MLGVVLAPFLLDAPHLTRAQICWFLPAGYLAGVLMSLPAVLSGISLAVALTLPRPRPLVQRDEHAVAPDRTAFPRATE